MAVDENLWRQCVTVCQNRPARLPAILGTVDSNRVLLVNGDDVMLRPDRRGDSEHPHMDFTQGANDEEALWVRREFGKNVIILDGLIKQQDWKFICYHEAHERRDMKRGMTYNAAHVRANAGERELRLRSRLPNQGART